ncbi:MAG: glycosyltransferase [Candidatus Methanomethyliaceae archaeon]
MHFDLVVVISSSLAFNPRAIKIVKALFENKNFRILLLEWNREKVDLMFPLNKNISLRKLNLRAPCAKPTLILYYFFFWLWVVINILIIKPAIIHACNLDTLIPCYLCKILTKSKLVYDSFDKFSLQYLPSRNRLLFILVDTLENVLTRASDAFITVSKERLALWGKYVPRLTLSIMNVPDKDNFIVKDILKSPFKSLYEDIDPKFKIVYAGSISQDKGLLIMKEAVEGIHDVDIVLAGKVYDDTLQKLLTDSRIRYVGLLPYQDAIRIQAQADTIIVLYDPIIPINRLANPNKLFEAMMLGVPVITNICKDIVRETQCGLTIEYNPIELRNAILLLKNNPILRKELGKNGREAFEKKYNWSIMGNKLSKLYESILNLK